MTRAITPTTPNKTNRRCAISAPEAAPAEMEPERVTEHGGIANGEGHDHDGEIRHLQLR
jgi:hypothetical protein